MRCTYVCAVAAHPYRVVPLVTGAPVRPGLDPTRATRRHGVGGSRSSGHVDAVVARRVGDIGHVLSVLVVRPAMRRTTVPRASTISNRAAPTRAGAARTEVNVAGVRVFAAALVYGRRRALQRQRGRAARTRLRRAAVVRRAARRESSKTYMPRPWVAAIRSPAAGCTARSRTSTARQAVRETVATSRRRRAPPHALAGARVEHVRVARIFAHDVHFARRKTVRRSRATCAEVVRDVDVRRAVADEVPVDDGVRRARAACEGSTAGMRPSASTPGIATFDHVRSAVARELHEAVVRPIQICSAATRRGRDREDRVERLRAGDVERQRAARKRLAVLDVAREVGADRASSAAAVARAERHVSAGVRRARVVRIERDRRLPVETILQPGRRDDVLVAQVRRDVDLA